MLSVNYNFVNDLEEKNILESLIDNNLSTSVTDLIKTFTNCCKGVWFAQMAFEKKISCNLYDLVDDSLPYITYDDQANELRSATTVYFDSQAIINNKSNYDCVSSDSNISIKVDIYKMDKRLTDTFELFVKTLSGRTITIYANCDTKISEIKRQIYIKEKILPTNQRLIYSGRQLSDEQTANECNICDMSTIHLVLRVRGGMHHVSSSKNDYNSIGDSCELPPKKISVYLSQNDIFITIVVSSDITVQHILDYCNNLHKKMTRKFKKIGNNASNITNYRNQVSSTIYKISNV